MTNLKVFTANPIFCKQKSFYKQYTLTIIQILKVIIFYYKLFYIITYIIYYYNYKF